MNRYHVEIDCRQTLGGMFALMDSKYVNAESEGEARAQVRAEMEPGHRIKRVMRIYTYEVTFRSKKDKRKRETWLVTAESEKSAVRRAFTKAFDKPGFRPESKPIKVVVK